jgi:iron-sulfur cluster assembly protein
VRHQPRQVSASIRFEAGLRRKIAPISWHDASSFGRKCRLGLPLDAGAASAYLFSIGLSPDFDPVALEIDMGMPLRRLQVVTLTDAAAERVRDIVARSEKPVLGVRVGVRNGGCAGMAYTVDVAEAPQPGDDIVEDKGATVLVDPKAVLFLLGTRMDYRTDKFASQFVFENPNQTSACGCGESVAIEPAKPEALTA